MSGNLGPLPLDNAENCKCWLVSFEAMCRTKSIEDTLTATKNSPKTDKFLEMCGTKSLLKVLTLLPGKNIEEIEFKNIKEEIIRYIEPKQRLVIADRTNFLSIKQNEGESYKDFLSRLNELSVLCKWEDLKSGDPANEMVKLKFIEGIKDEAMKLKVLEQIQARISISLTEIVDFCQMCAQMSSFVGAETSPEPVTAFHVTKKEFLCNRCGMKHLPKSCPAYKKSCNKCGKSGHFAKVCRNKRFQNKPKHVGFEKQSSHSIDVFSVDAFENSGITKDIRVCGKILKFQLDTGASVSIMSEHQWQDLGQPKLEPTSVAPTNYDGSVLETLGELQTEIFIENSLQAKFIVVKSNKCFGLIGRDIIDKQKSNVCTYSVDYEELPTIRGFTASIVLTDASKPLKFCPARSVPLHLKEKLDSELDSLQRQGIISPVEFAKCASPVVWVKKPNGRYRLCVDFKATLNSNIQADSYPLPTIEEIMGRMGNAKKFAKIDLKTAYWQIALDEQSKSYSVINTHKGLFVLNRLQMGMKNASAIFQRCIEQVLKGIQNVIIYQDDLMVFAENATQLKKRVTDVKKRLREHSVTINAEKCIQCTDSLSFLGYVFSEEGMKPDMSLVCKINETAIPSTKEELSRFLRMLNFFAKFIPSFSEVCAPLYEARKGDSLKWSEECSKSFLILKKALSTPPVLQPFSLQKSSVVTTDASEKSLGAVLTQEGRPVIYISRKLTSTEARYSNIEREALAVVWACCRLQQFLVGKKFLIQTDHQPLVYILNPCMSLKSDISPRLMRFSIKMMRFDYDIQHIPGSKNVIADSLSRINTHDDCVSTPQVHFTEPCIDLDLLKLESNNDRFLNDLKLRIITGRWSDVSRWERQFKKLALQLTVDQHDLIRVGSKIVPPKSLYHKIFQNAHQTHSGVQSTLKMIQKEFFWPNMRFTIESFVKACDECQRYRFRSPDTTHTWSKEEAPWSRVHIDWAYVRHHGNILVIADSYSGWLEASFCSNRNVETVINELRGVFARFGVPQTLVSDNAPEFAGGRLRSWLEGMSCRLLHTPEYRPSSNGLAERMVKFLKDGLKFYSPSKCSISSFVHRLLFVHRNTARRNGKTPAELMMQYSVRCPILSSFKPSQEVWYKPNASRPAQPVTFLFRKGSNTSLVAHPDGRTVVAHDAQLANRGPVLRRSSRQGRPVRRYPDVDPTSEAVPTLNDGGMSSAASLETDFH